MTSSSSLAELDRFVAVLEYRIQRAIAKKIPDSPPTIRCRLQQGRLLVLAEDAQAAATAPARDERFKSLALAISTLLAGKRLPEGFLNGEGELPVRLYLRQQGDASPYAARNWGWKPMEIAQLFHQATPGMSPAETPEEGPGTGGAIVLLSSLKPEDTGTADDEDAFPVDAPAPPRRPPLWQTLRQTWQRQPPSWPSWPWRSVSGLVVAGLVLGGVAYGVSRPCLVGECDRRQTASDLSQAVVTDLQSNPTFADINRGHEELLRAIRLVSAIPPWSPHYDAAQAELMRYRTQLSDLEWIIDAQENAAEAAEKSQDPPHPVPRWVEVHLLWKKAIADLQRVPEKSLLADFVQRKLTEYQANYDAIGQRLMVEEQAEANLNKAIQAGQLATTHTENAATLADWLAAQRQWQQAMNALDRIPQGTLAYEEARSFRSDYYAKFTQIRNRVSVESIGERTYQSAIANAAEAQAAQRANQWTLAVSHWRDANAQMRQVPESSLRHAEAQSQLASYQTALKQAEQRLQQAVALETIADDLETLCPIDQGICTFSYTSRQVNLTLRDPYDSAVRQSISPPSTQGQLAQTASIVEETHQLVQNIMRLGNRIQIPIALYTTDQQFIARYQPEYGGFVKQP